MQNYKMLVPGWIILITISLVSCKKDDQLAAFTSKEIFGTWQWVQSSGGFAGGTYTSANTAYSQVLQFNRDSSYVIHTNDTLVESGRFTIKEEKTMYGEQLMPVIRFQDGQMSETIFQLTPDSLTLAQNCYDCYVVGYVRISVPATGDK
jgi:hypothetical protein